MLGAKKLSMMIFLRVFLYLVCIISVGWSVLVFGGPPIVKRLILVYSNGALMPSDVAVSPGLDLSISRLDFILPSEIAGRPIEGFSRATKIEWSLFGEKPFLELNLGPSVVKNFATAESVRLYTPSFQKIDWQNIALSANIYTLNLNSFARINSIDMAGNLNLESAVLSNIKVEAKRFGGAAGNSTFFANLIESDLRNLNLMTPLDEQFFASAFAIEEIIVSEPNLTIPKAILDVAVTEDARNLMIDLFDVSFPEVGGFIKNVKIDGGFNKSYFIDKLNLDLVDGIFFSGSPQFSEISVRASGSDNQYFKANVEGDLDEYEMADSENFIGIVYAGNFVIDLYLDRPALKANAKSKINFNTLNSADIFGSVDVGFTSELFANLACMLGKCELSITDLNYNFSFDEQWVRGSAECPKSLCGLSDMEHSLRTSNTVKLFTILNQENILNPLSSLYLFGVISSGQELNGGHELKF